MQTKRDADPDVDQQGGIQLREFLLQLSIHKIPSRTSYEHQHQNKRSASAKGTRQVSQMCYLCCFIKKGADVCVAGLNGIFALKLRQGRGTHSRQMFKSSAGLTHFISKKTEQKEKKTRGYNSGVKFLAFCVCMCLWIFIQ